jgi:hypothetical protein
MWSRAKQGCMPRCRDKRGRLTSRRQCTPDHCYCGSPSLPPPSVKFLLGPLLDPESCLRTTGRYNPEDCTYYGWFVLKVKTQTQTRLLCDFVQSVTVTPNIYRSGLCSGNCQANDSNHDRTTTYPSLRLPWSSSVSPFEWRGYTVEFSRLVSVRIPAYSLSMTNHIPISFDAIQSMQVNPLQDSGNCVYRAL